MAALRCLLLTDDDTPDEESMRFEETGDPQAPVWITGGEAVVWSLEECRAVRQFLNEVLDTETNSG